MACSDAAEARGIMERRVATPGQDFYFRRSGLLWEVCTVCNPDAAVPVFVRCNAGCGGGM